ncbi:MAG TPA: hypothetical protein VLB44_23855, partial [Kofleriaceae bacterium]|nr:hypothetical protein [Kofleriaceae bacterium]
DVYALGCVLFEILVGRPLNDKTSAARQNRPSVRAPDRRVPPELDEIVVAATHADRKLRTASARELGAAVQRFLDGDRDVARRRELATQHLSRAREALGGNERVAMKEAGRALALDPTLAPAADIVGRLMLEPPKHSPPEVKAALYADAMVDGQRQARIALFSYLSYLTAALVLLLVSEAREPGYGWALVAILVVNSGLSVVGLRWPESQTRGLLLTLFNLAMVAVSARMLPMLIAPGVAAIVVMASAGNPFLRGRIFTPVVSGLAIACAIGPLFAERFGWLSRTYEVVPEGVMLYPPILAPGLDPLSVVSLAAMAVIGLSAMWAHVRSERETGVRERLHVQAWRLRHLIEEEPT